MTQPLRGIRGVKRNQTFWILSWNINGLPNKLAGSDFIDEISHHDIIILTETWLTKNTI